MTTEHIVQYSAPDEEKKRRRRTPKRPDRPLFTEELAEALPNRPALKAADGAIELDLMLSVDGEPEIDVTYHRSDGSFLVGRDRSELERSTPWQVRLAIKNLSLGVHSFPPQVEVVEFDPDRSIEEAQLDFPGVDGSAPDHLPLRTWPLRLPRQLEVPRRLGRDLLQEEPDEDRIHYATTIFGPDNRYLFNDTSYPWCTVGRVTTPGGTASGTMVGPRHLLTCSHAIQWNPDNTAGWVRFAPSYFDGSEPFGAAWGTRVYWQGTKVFGPTINRNEGQHDYVCVVLDRNIGNLTGWMGSRSWSDDWDHLAVWRHIGYPGDLAGSERPSYQRDIALDGSFWDREVHTRIFHQGDVWPGQSGGPFFAWWAGEDFPRVVADQSGQNSDENTASGGAHMVDCIIRARNDFP
jgi:V8-like Glu-specific endopeptidase